MLQPQKTLWKVKLRINRIQICEEKKIFHNTRFPQWTPWTSTSHQRDLLIKTFILQMAKKVGSISVIFLSWSLVASADILHISKCIVQPDKNPGLLICKLGECKSLKTHNFSFPTTFNLQVQFRRLLQSISSHTHTSVITCVDRVNWGYPAGSYTAMYLPQKNHITNTTRLVSKKLSLIHA